MAVVNALISALQEIGFYVYERSVDVSGSTACAIAKRDGKKYLAVLGEADGFTGEKEGDVLLCPLSVENAKKLFELFPYTRPQSHANHKFTFGLGDRLGLASPGHVRAIAGYGAYPILAQQSIRELNLTGRTFSEVVAAAAFGVFQEGYKGGYGADGDHLKSKEEIAYALSSGCSMITLDCSEHIDANAALLSEAEVETAYAALAADVRAHYESKYLGAELPFVGLVQPIDLKRIVLVFWKAIIHAVECYHYINEISTADVDFEMSIDETRAITTPAEHYIIANELISHDVHPISLAPHFSGEFEKGIEYSGNLNDFARDFEIHQKIAVHFGYKLSVHSGSDKFSVFSTVGRVTGCHVHVKTAGTNWLEAMRVVAKKNPTLYRKAHKFALEHRAEAEKYYHVSTDPKEIPNIDLQNDAYLPEYLDIPASRQSIHIAYGLLLGEKWFRDEFFPFMAEHEEEYYAGLVSHIGRHLKYLTTEC